MATTKSYLELKKLERYQLALNNAMSDPRMSDPLNKVGVSAEVLEEGRNLLNIANKAFNDSYAAKKKRTEVYEIYVKKSDALDALFMIDKKKAKIAFISDELAWNKLGLNKTFHKNRLKQFDIIRIFYTVLSGNQD
jgi:hypothetical protein